MADPLAKMIEALPQVPPHPCPYLAGRMASERAFAAREFDPDIYHALMDRGFRRSGEIFYSPVCPDCRQCVPLRVGTTDFRPTKSQRRVWRRNADVTVSVERPVDTPQKRDLYRRYLAAQHGPRAPTDEDGLVDFLYTSPVETLEFAYHAGDRLLGIGICDVCRQSLSSVYFYFEPAAADRSLGTFSGMYEIAWAAERGIPYYYLGFYVRESPAMNYKARFGPCELLGPNGQWRPFTAADKPPVESCGPS